MADFLYMNSIRNRIRGVYLISFIANTCLIYFVYSYINNLEELAIDWRNNISKNITSATHLAEIERQFGYLGFIHHFKNFVIRRDEIYLTQAIESHQKAIMAIEKFKQSDWGPEALDSIKALEATLNEYRLKLEIAIKNSKLASEVLDDIVKVDDAQAAVALNELRLRLIPRVELNNGLATQRVVNMRNYSLFTGAVLVLLFLILSGLTIHALRKLQGSLKETSEIYENAPDAILLVNETGRIIKANAVASVTLGYSNAELITMTVHDLIPEEMRHQHPRHTREFMQKTQKRDMANRGSELYALRKNGDKINVRISISSVIINNSKRGICIVKDMTKHNELVDRAETDHLTGLYNRRAFDEALKVEISRGSRKQDTISLFIVDIDNFKSVNDTYGHSKGDDLIIAVAEFLKIEKRQYDLLTRWGGDEFAILSPGLTMDDAILFANRIIDRFGQSDSAKRFCVTISIGAATASLIKKVPPNQLYDTADKALYKAKEEGKNCARHLPL